MINLKIFKSPQWPRLLLDLVMLILAVVHFGLLVFDSTYFRLRNFYSYYVPQVVLFYDPVKGISPHQFTSSYLSQASEYFSSCQAANSVDPKLQAQLVQLSEQMIEENPFERAGLTGQLEIIKENMRKFTGHKSSSKMAFRSFWQEGCARLDMREKFYHKRIAPYIQTNFWRQIDTDGQPVDHFLIVDLGFICLFLLEFLLSWISAVRKFGPDQKILFPLYHWYDLVSCIPLRELRYLRLLRILSLYVRLVQSEVILLKELPLYNRFLKYQRMILEEISDQVALNILNNIQAKTRLGTNRELVEEILKTYRHAIQELMVVHLQRFQLPHLNEKREAISDMLADILWDSIQASEDYRRLQQIPFLNTALDQALNKPKLERMAAQSLDIFLAEAEQKLQSPEMKDFLTVLVADLIDQVIEISRDDEIQTLLENIHLAVLEELKKSSIAKTWKPSNRPGKNPDRITLLPPPSEKP
ncbi:MAG: hypothetical protein AB7I41_17975 [Candidatus Sericytochromatia bacterium]